MQLQNDEYADVVEFLGSIKLEKYLDKLVQNGVEDIETVMELQDRHIEQMGIPLGHKLKIIKRIKDLKAEGKGASQIEYNEGISSRPVTKIEYEALPDPSEDVSTQQSSIGAEPRKFKKQV